MGKTGYVDGDDIIATKIAGGGGKFAGNTGMVIVMDQKTLKPRMIMQDEGLLTEIRTAAATCYVSSLFAPVKIDKIGIIGGGIQAIWQLRFLRNVTSCRKVLLKTSSPES